jgi:hypothetical protein
MNVNPFNITPGNRVPASFHLILGYNWIIGAPIDGLTLSIEVEVSDSSAMARLFGAPTIYFEAPQPW